MPVDPVSDQSATPGVAHDSSGSQAHAMPNAQPAIPQLRALDTGVSAAMSPDAPLTPSRAPTTGPSPASPLPAVAATSNDMEMDPDGAAAATSALAIEQPPPKPRKLTAADLRVRFYNATAAIYGERLARRHLRSSNVAASFARPSATNAGPFAFRVGADAAGLWTVGRAWAGGFKYGGFVKGELDGRLASGLESAGGVDGSGCGAAYA